MPLTGQLNPARGSLAPHSSKLGAWFTSGSTGTPPRMALSNHQIPKRILGAEQSRAALDRMDCMDCVASKQVKSEFRRFGTPFLP